MVSQFDKDITSALEYSSYPSNKAVVNILDTVDVFHPNKLKANIAEKIKDFQEEDMFLVAGNVMAVSITLHKLLEKFKKVNILLYNAKTKRYVLRGIDK